MIYKENIFKFFDNYFIYLVFFTVLSPIFVSLDFSEGIKFDAHGTAIKYLRPSIPISLIAIGILSLHYFKDLYAKKELRFLVVLIIIYGVLNIYNGTLRAVIVGFGMLIPLISFYIFKLFFIKKQNLYKSMYVTLFSIVIIKFFIDIYYINYLDEFANYYFSTYHYFIKSINIYSYEDYFSFIYYLAIVLSVNNIINKAMIKSSIFLIIVSSLAALDTNSRLFIYGIYLLPILYIFYRFTKYNLKVYFYIFMSISMGISILIGFVDLNFEELGLKGLDIRNMHIFDYFSNFVYINVLFPFFNQYRIETLGSFHNELIEIFSFFGFIVVYYYYLIMKIFLEVKEEYKLISYFLMFIIIIGALIQLNISNPYVGIILGMIIAILSLDNNRQEKDEP